jgi:hypothetical protein
MGTKTKRKESNLEHRQSVLLAKREELIGRLHARRSEIVAERESDDEAGIALQAVIRDFTYVSLENEIRTLAEVDSLCGDWRPANTDYAEAAAKKLHQRA